MTYQTIYLRYSSLSGDFQNLTNKAKRLILLSPWLKKRSQPLACRTFTVNLTHERLDLH